MISFTTSPERVTVGYCNSFYSMFVAFVTSFRVEAISISEAIFGSEAEFNELAITQYVENIQSNEIRQRVKRITWKIFSIFWQVYLDRGLSDEDREFLRKDPLEPFRIAHKELPVRPRWSNEVSPCLILSNLKMDNGLNRKSESTVSLV